MRGVGSVELLGGVAWPAGLLSGVAGFTGGLVQSVVMVLHGVAAAAMLVPR